MPSCMKSGILWNFYLRYWIPGYWIIEGTTIYSNSALGRDRCIIWLNGKLNIKKSKIKWKIMKNLYSFKAYSIWILKVLVFFNDKITREGILEKRYGIFGGWIKVENNYRCRWRKIERMQAWSTVSKRYRDKQTGMT